MRPQLQMETHGDVPSDFQREIEEEIEGCYRSLPASDLQAVQVCLFDTVERLKGFQNKERTKLGIATSGGEEFLATHDAWRGIPRITICLERITQAPALVRRGAIRHEVAHTILHGSPAFYTFKLSRDLLARGRKRGLDAPALQQLLYFVAIAVKDCEAVKLLLDHGHLDCQVALALYQMEASEEDKLAWLLARSNPPLRLICLAAQLKPLLFVRPLLEAHPNRQSLERKARAMLSFLPPDDRDKLWELSERIASQMGEKHAHTHWNVEMALELVLKEL